MSQWGQPRHAGTRHNMRVRGGGTWAKQDRRLRRHVLDRFNKKRGRNETWSGQVQRLDRRGPWERYIMGILLLGIAVVVLSAGGSALVVLMVAALFLIAWRGLRPRRR